ncbi:outer membrane channel protein TolC [soil metagenome]
MSRRRVLAEQLLLALALIAPLRAHGEDLIQIYGIARQADPVLSAAEANRQVVGEEVVQARATLLPQVSAGFDVSDNHVSGNNDDGTTGAYRTRNVSANLSQVLLDVSRFARLDAAHARSEAQDAIYRSAEQTLIIRVATAYFDVLLAADNLKTAEANEDAYRQQVDQADQRFRNGLAAQVDLEQARSYYSAARSSTIANRKIVDDARDALAEITGVAPGPLKALRESLPMNPPSPADPAKWVDVALEANPTLRAQQRTIAAAESGISAARAGRLPVVSAGVNVGRGASWPNVSSSYDGRTVTSIGINVSVPLFTGGAISSQVRQAAAIRDGARDDLESQRRQIVRATQERYRSVIAGIDQTIAARESVDSAQKALASTRVGLGLGTQTMTDLLLAIRTLTAAQTDYSQSRHQFVLGRLLLLQAAGTITESDLVSVNALLR